MAYNYYPYEDGYMDVEFRDGGVLVDPDQDATFYVELYDADDTLQATFTLATTPAITKISTGRYKVEEIDLSSFAVGSAYAHWYAKLSGVEFSPYPYEELVFSVLEDATGLCTREDLKTYLRIPSTDTSQDAFLDHLVTRTTAFIQSYTRQTLLETTHTEYFSGNGSSRTVVKEMPVTAVTVLTDDKSGQADFDYTDADLNVEFGFEEWGLIVLMNGLTFRKPDSIYPPRNYKVTYTAGYSSVPDDLRQVAVELAARTYYRKEHQKQGKATHSLGGETVTYTADELTSMQRAMLAPFKVKLHRGV